ncbi:MAG: hypothetical protein EOO15_18990 [Chitinophagaceae bacterium]|nr:MAG: hypothetical protein EOO15_18990 [Chitinophagaceae bacterium]
MKGPLLFLAVTMGCAAGAQTDSMAPVFIVQRYDSLAKVTSVQLSRPLTCSPDQRKGLLLEPLFAKSRNGSIRYRSLQCQIVGVGDCNGSNRIIFYFVGGGRLELPSIIRANCKGNTWFDPTGTELERLARPVRRIRFVSGRHYKSFVYDVPEADRNYFMEVRSLLLRESKAFKAARTQSN